MSLQYTSGEEIRAGDVVIWLNQSGEFYQFDQAIMKVWEVAKTNDGELVGVNLMPPQAESPMQMLRALVRPEDPEPSSDIVKMQDVPGLYTITRWFLPIEQVSKSLGLVERIEYFSEHETGHGASILQLIRDKTEQYRGIYQYYLADQAYQEREFQLYIDLLRQSAQSGYTPAMCQLAQQLFIGGILQKSLEGSFNWYREAASKMDSIALYQLAGCYARGHGSEQDLQKSLQLLEQSSEQGCWAATLGLAAYYRFGWLTCFLVNSVYPNYGVVSEHVIHSARAFYLYHRISSQAPETEKGVLANAYYHLGWMYQDGIGTKRDYEQCVYWYQKSADLGNPVAINNLADKYEHGLGVSLDLDMAIGLYQQVAGQVIAADLSLGRMYLEGRGVEQDFELARKYLNVVLDARIEGIDEMQADAMQLIASFTEESPLQLAQHVLKNARDYSIEQVSEQIGKIDSFLHMDEAKQLFFKLFLLNAQKGEASSQYQVGYWYLNGLYTEKNLEEAVYWIQKAADQKDQYAECKIGYLYEKGLYFNADLDVAQKWYERSLRKPCTSYTPEYIGEQLNPEYLKMYDRINNEALKGLVRIEEKRPKRSKWQFWKK